MTSIITISTYGFIKTLKEKYFYWKGLIKLIEVLNPKTIIVYGSMNQNIFSPIFFNSIDIINFKVDFFKKEIKYKINHLL